MPARFAAIANPRLSDERVLSSPGTDSIQSAQLLAGANATRIEKYANAKFSSTQPTVLESLIRSAHAFTPERELLPFNEFRWNFDCHSNGTMCWPGRWTIPSKSNLPNGDCV